jgi:ferredoxin-type protein NapH
LILFLFIVTGTVCTAILVSGTVVSEPLGALQLILALGFSSTNLSLMSQALFVGAVIFVVLTILLGRAFCAWACPVGTTIDAVDTVLEKLRFRPFLARRGKKDGATANPGWIPTNYGVLASVLASSALFRYPAWCVLCPIGTICRGVAAGGELAIGAELLALPAAGALSLGRKRFWCRYLCPVGALLTLLGRINLFIKPRIANHEEHVDCGACRTICPEGIDVAHEKTFARCTKCLDCYVKCPHGSVRIALK